MRRFRIGVGAYLAVACATMASTLCAQVLCLARTPVVESFLSGTPTVQPNGQNGMYNVTYYLEVTWKCTGGNPTQCTVCEQDTLCQQTVPDGPYEPMSGRVLFSTDGPAQCIAGGDSTWYGQFVNVPAGYFYELVCSYKLWTPYSGCNDPTGTQVGKTVVFHT